MAKERPLLFSAPMVQAILNGTKSQTRRLIKNPEFFGCFTGDCPHLDEKECRAAIANLFIPEFNPFGLPGDKIWVRETWYCDHCFERDYRLTRKIYVGQTLTDKECEAEWHPHLFYRADNPEFEDGPPKWSPSIHMPRWASRITLEIIEVRVERLREISEESARAEGAAPYDPTAYFTISEMGGAEHIADWEYRAGFAKLWNSLAKPGATWRDNPWVAVIEFKVVASS